MHYFLMAIFSRNILSRNSVFRDIFSRAILSCVINVREIFSQDLNSRIFFPMAFFSQDWDNAQTFHEVYIIRWTEKYLAQSGSEPLLVLVEFYTP